MGGSSPPRSGASCEDPGKPPGENPCNLRVTNPLTPWFAGPAYPFAHLHFRARDEPSTGTIRLAVIDDDSGFVTVLSKRLDGAGWEYHVRQSSLPVEEIVAMKLNAVLVDLSLLGPDGWDFLERVCGAIPGLGVLVCTGHRRSPSASAGCGSAPTTGSTSPAIPKR